MKTRTELYAYKVPKRSRFLTFLLALTLTFLVGTWLVQHTILDDVFVQHQMEDSKGYQEFTDQFNKTINAQAQQSGIPSSTLKNIVSKTTVEQVINTTMANIYAKKENPINATPILTEIDQKVQAKTSSIAAASGVSTTAISETVQAKFQTYIADQAQPYGNQAVSAIKILESVSHVLIVVSGILSLIIAALIIYRSHGHVQGWRYLFWGIFWAGLFVAFPGVLLRFSDLIVNIAENAHSYSSIILTLISSILMVFVRVGAIVTVLGLFGVLVCIVLPSFGKRKEKGKY
ncbi:hypothetical protein [Lapidilactobacillus bayanensis]|uniref:hypothetical protein n=1 Tax=Lapidilactobacillus bayanensis TaxID=2485998 RepID=UPI000F76F7FC|nr:hypothetical protein [Lapidilactobacillus bayanensis]